jgi:hypothetical protein
LALTSVPAATITAPRPDTTLGGSSATITGTAGGPNFASYSVRYGLGLYPSNWTTIRSSSTAISDGTLATWNLSGLADNAAYTLQLRVTDTSGNS